METDRRSLHNISLPNRSFSEPPRTYCVFFSPFVNTPFSTLTTQTPVDRAKPRKGHRGRPVGLTAQAAYRAVQNTEVLCTC